MDSENGKADDDGVTRPTRSRVVGPEVVRFSGEQVRDLVAALEVPFDPIQIQWRVMNTTKNATGRVIPLNSRILTVVREWASLFSSQQPEHYVFPCERYGAAGDAFTACAYHTNPLRPITSWKVAWGAAKQRAGLEGPGVGHRIRIRFHDLRHTACTRMLEGGVSFHVVAQIMGWSATSMIRMSQRYGHIGQGAQRQAVELLGRSLTQADSFEKSHEVLMGMGGRIQ